MKTYRPIQLEEAVNIVDKLVAQEIKNRDFYISLNPHHAAERSKEANLICAAYCKVIYHLGEITRGEECTAGKEAEA